MKRRVTLILCTLDLAAWALIAFFPLFSGSSNGLDGAALAGATALLAVTALPAFLLVRLGRFPDAALAFALAFPAVLVLLLGLVLASLP